MIEPTVSASYARAFAEFAVSLGADRAGLLKMAGIDPESLADPDQRIALSDYRSLVGAAKALTERPAIAIHFGESPLFFERSILGLIIRASPTMGEAFRQMNRFGPVINDFQWTGTEGRFVVTHTETGAWLEDRRASPNEFPEITESAFARLVCEFERIFPDRGRFALAVEMTHEAPPYRSEYERVLKAPLKFGAARNAIRIESAWLDAPIPTANSYVFGIFSKHAELLLKELELSKTFRGEVERRLIPILHTGEIGMDELAGAIGLSRSSLYRRLKAEGVTFDEVVDDLRRRMADHYLAGAKTTIAEIAYLVGFSDPGAFSKAYKRWTGASPSNVRLPKS
jgi:AraC-like DNA-binding protein